VTLDPKQLEEWERRAEGSDPDLGEAVLVLIAELRRLRLLCARLRAVEVGGLEVDDTWETVLEDVEEELGPYDPASPPSAK